jgi:hypothetical protein
MLIASAMNTYHMNNPFKKNGYPYPVRAGVEKEVIN